MTDAKHRDAIMVKHDANHRPQRLLKEDEVAEFLNMEVSTLRRWRWAGRGPVYRKLGAAVRYDAADLRDFIEASRRTSTSDSGPETV